MNVRSVFLVLVLISTGSGCTVLDRESYSLVIRKPAHQYEKPEKPSPVDAAGRTELCSGPDVSPHSPAYVRDDLDEMIGILAPRLVPFVPFAYCHLHESSHAVESVVAVALVPAEFPLSLATTIASYEKQLGFVWMPGDPSSAIVFFSAALLWAALKSLLAPPLPPPDPYAPVRPTR